jgi:hypothetical protein
MTHAQTLGSRSYSVRLTAIEAGCRLPLGLGIGPGGDNGRAGLTIGGRVSRLRINASIFALTFAPTFEKGAKPESRGLPIVSMTAEIFPMRRSKDL